jgi:DNA polymerase I
MQAHVKAAQRAKQYGLSAEVGAKVAYVVLKGSGKIGDRSYPADVLAKKNGKLVDTKGEEKEIDVDYYVTHQILPSVGRVLNYFGYNDSNLAGKPLQKTLDHF